jgi:hypothetical protein
MNIAVWGAAIYCAWALRDSPVVGAAKPTFRERCGKRSARIGKRRQVRTGNDAGVGCGTAALRSHGHYQLLAFRGGEREQHVQRSLRPWKKAGRKYPRVDVDQKRSEDWRAWHSLRPCHPQWSHRTSPIQRTPCGSSRPLGPVASILQRSPSVPWHVRCLPKP